MSVFVKVHSGSRRAAISDILDGTSTTEDVKGLRPPRPCPQYVNIKPVETCREAKCRLMAAKKPAKKSATKTPATKTPATKTPATKTVARFAPPAKKAAAKAPACEGAGGKGTGHQSSRRESHGREESGTGSRDPAEPTSGCGGRRSRRLPGNERKRARSTRRRCLPVARSKSRKRATARR